MKDTKRALSLYSFYDHTGMERHWERQAEKGWLLDKIDSWGWRYRRIEPKKLRFAAVYSPAASAFDPEEPTEEARSFRDFCARAGWVPAATQQQMRIFYNEDPDAVPIETDAAVQVETIHRAMKRNYLPGAVFLTVLALGEMGMSLWLLRYDPIGFLASTVQLTPPLIWLLLAVLLLTDVFSYLRWHKQAREAAERGEFLSTKSRVWLQRTALALMALLLLGWARSLFSRQMGGVIVFAVAFVAVLAVPPRLLMEFMKRKGVPAKTARIAYWVFGVVMTVSATTLLIALTPRADLLTRKAPETYEYKGITFKIWHDPLPLTVQDLGQSDYGEYSTEAKRDASPLLVRTEYTQQPRLDALEEPELTYTVLDVRLSFLYNYCRDQRLDAAIDGYEPEEYRNHWETQDPAAWGAEEAYRLYTWDGDPYNRYLICWPGRIVAIRFDWEITAEQTALAAEALRP